MLHRLTHYLTAYWMPVVSLLLLAFIMRQCSIPRGVYVPRQKTYFHYVHK